MANEQRYPRRLIEVDLPIKRISEHARREKRQGHISSLHTWWARRPLAACRAVVCAALWPDPADDLCPESFREIARKQMQAWASDHLNLCGEESWNGFVAISKNATALADNALLRQALFDFIADYASWDNSSVREYLDTSRALTQAAHEALGGAPGSRPLIVDPFAGGGAIPLESLRVGADAFASDLNPVPVLLNKVVLEYIPKYGPRLADEVRKWGAWVGKEVEKELAEFYPKDSDGATPIAYLWARTVQCEGPGCGAHVPVTRSLWIDQSRGTRWAIRLEVGRGKKTIVPTVLRDPEPAAVGEGTSKRSSVTCPCCGYTTPRQSVEAYAKKIGFGQMLMAVALETGKGRAYRDATPKDLSFCERAEERLRDPAIERLLPTEALPYLRSIFNVHVYGLQTWRALFSPRQLLYLATLVKTVTHIKLPGGDAAAEEGIAVRTLLALVVSKCTTLSCNIARWRGDKGRLEGAFAMQALPMVWDWGELNPFNKSIVVFDDLVSTVASVIETTSKARLRPGIVEMSSAVAVPLPDDAAAVVFTDPPYYDSIPYANLSDFFYVWLKRLLAQEHPGLFRELEAPKDNEIVQLAERNALYAHKTKAFFEAEMERAMSDARRVTEPNGIACIVFAHKTTAGWEALLNAVLRAGWVVTASWPIDTEMATRFKAIGTASLNSSIHLVCRPREGADGSVRTEDVGDWRKVLQELPRRIHEWMPRLALEGVVGADAIFACLGPALEIYSRYDRVEKASGEAVSLKEYLEQVWAAVAKEALSLIFEDVDATGLEEDARLTAMWLWTLSTDGGAATATEGYSAEDDDEDREAEATKAKAVSGFTLEFDAARKIAQGLGAHLEALSHVVEVDGDQARLLSVAERTRYLFGKEQAGPGRPPKKKRSDQLTLFDELTAAEDEGGWGDVGVPPTGESALDRVHQAMILFGAGRGEAMRRFLVDNGAGREARFWKIAQSLSALYPARTDEKRWVDGVLARKKGLGFG